MYFYSTLVYVRHILFAYLKKNPIICNNFFDTHIYIILSKKKSPIKQMLFQPVLKFRCWPVYWSNIEIVWPLRHSLSILVRTRQNENSRGLVQKELSASYSCPTIHMFPSYPANNCKMLYQIVYSHCMHNSIWTNSQ